MIRFLLSRFIQSLFVLFFVYTATFWLLMMAPGDPFVGEKNVTPVVRAAIAERYEVPYLAIDPAKRAQMSRSKRFGYLFRAYIAYIRRLITGNPPTTEYQDWTVTDVIASALPVSAALGAFALVLAVWFGLITGTLGAVYKNRWPDIGLTILTLLGISVPTFVVASLLVMFFGALLPVLPAGGWGTVRQIILPALALALFYLAYIARFSLASVLDVLSADYVRTARAKGVPRLQVIGSHVLRNASLPVLSFIGPAAATVLTGSFVVEKIFAIPGLGSHFVNACLNVDIPLVLGAVMVYTVLIVMLNLLVDILYVFADPRISFR